MIYINVVIIIIIIIIIYVFKLIRVNANFQNIIYSNIK